LVPVVVQTEELIRKVVVVVVFHGEMLCQLLQEVTILLQLVLQVQVLAVTLLSHITVAPYMHIMDTTPHKALKVVAAVLEVQMAHKVAALEEEAETLVDQMDITLAVAQADILVMAVRADLVAPNIAKVRAGAVLAEAFKVATLRHTVVVV
jgi:hypothetical protein